MYIYLGRYYHKSGKELSDLTEKKIGLTKNLENRERELNSTKFTVGYTFVKAWQTGEDTNKVEKSLHALLDDVRMDGEWFEDSNKTLISRVAKYMSINDYPEVDLDGSSTEDEKRAIDLSNSEVLNNTVLEVEERLKALNLEFDKKLDTQGPIFYKIPYNDIKLVLGVYKSGTKFYLYASGKNANKYFDNRSEYTLTADGYRLGEKGELYATDIEDLFIKLDIFIQAIKGE